MIRASLIALVIAHAGMLVASELPGISKRVLHDGTWDVTVRQTADFGQIHDLNRLSVKVLRIDFSIRGDNLKAVGDIKSIERIILTTKLTKELLLALPHLRHIRNLTLNCTDTDAALADEVPKAVKDLANLETLWLGADITDDGLDPISQMEGLRWLGINSRRFHGPGLSHLGMHPTLVELALSCFNTDEKPFDFREFRHLQRLQAIDLGAMAVTDHACAEVAALKNLRKVNVCYWDNICPASSDFTIMGLRRIKTLPHLEELAIGGDAAKDALGEYAEIKGLKVLRINSELDDDALQKLSSCANLEELSIVSNSLRGPGLEHLAPLKKLRKLRLWCMKMDPDGLKHLQSVAQLQALNLTFMFQLEKQHKPWDELANLTQLKSLDLTRIGRIDGRVEEIRKSLPECEIIR